MQFNRAKFWAAYEKQFGPIPHTIEKPATEGLLGFLESDPQIDRIEWAAYILGTIRNECGANMSPVKEKKARPGTQVWEQWQSKYWFTGFYGRGYSQLTGEGNYRQFSELLYKDDRLVKTPDLVMDPAVGYKILATGCVKGMFRGRKGGARYKLADFLNDNAKDYLHARQIVNGMAGKALEHAQRVAGYCAHYEACLRAASEGSAIASAATDAFEATPAPPAQIADTIVNTAPVAAMPIVPDGPAEQVSNPIAARAWAGGGIGLTFLTGIGAWLTAHMNIVVVCVIGAVLIVLIILCRSVILDWLRLHIASRQDLRNVK